MSETPKSTRSTRSVKSVSFNDSQEYIPAPDYEEEAEHDHRRRQSAPPVPYFHAPDDFPVDDQRCCALWPYCGDAVSVLSYPASQQANTGSGLDHDGRTPSLTASLESISIDIASTRNITRVESHRVSPVDVGTRASLIPGNRHHYRSGQSEITLVDTIKEFEEEIDKRWSQDGYNTTCPSSPVMSDNDSFTMTKGDIVGDHQDVDIEKGHSLEISVVHTPPSPGSGSYEVSFTGPNDPLNPKNWSSKKKWRMIACVAAFTFLSPLSSSILAPGLSDIARDLNITSDIEIQMVLSILVLAFAVGPPIFGPLSELYGRVIVLQGAHILFLVFTIGCGFAQSRTQIMACRFLAGLGGSAPLAVGGAILGDLFLPHQRGNAMMIYAMGPFLGPAVGPIIGAFIAANSTWRWMFWSTAAASALILTLSFVFFKETYEPVLLKRKAAALRESSGIDFYRSQFEKEDTTVAKSIASALTRAFKMLFTEPIVFVMALYMAYAYGTMYLVLATFPRLWTGTYHESQSIAGLNYLSLGLGFLLGAPITGKITDKLYRHMTAKQAASSPSMQQGPGSVVKPGSGPPLATKSPSKETSGPPGAHSPSAPPNKPPPPQVSLPGPPGGPPRGPPFGPPGPRGKPEYRLPVIIAFSILPPLGLLIYGWTSHYHLHWLLPNLGTFLFSFGTVAIFQCVTAYLVDSYTRYAASAIAGVTVFRSLAGFGFPIFAPEMYKALGMGWGNSLLGFVAVGVGCSTPVLLFVFGEGLRRRSKLAVG